MSSPELITLIDMGFEKKRAERALEVTGFQGVEPAMEWLLAHVDEQLPPFEESVISREPEQIQEQVIPQQAAPQHVTDDYSVPMDVDPVEYSEDENIGDNEKTDVTQAELAKSLKCDECGKLFSSEVDVQVHAAKSGHSKFSESSEEKKPLNEEEKREQLKKLEEKMKAKRVEREEKEKKDALEREKMRIRSGKEMVAAKKKLEEQEMKKLVDQRRREKLEEKMARQRVKEQIEQDKLARRAKFGMGPSSESLQTFFAPQTSDGKSKSNTSLTKDYSQTKLQIRLTNGQALTQTFGSKEQLSAVRLYVEMNRTDGDGPFSLMTNFPKKVFTDDDYEKPLDVLGLVPSAVVIVSRATKN